MGINSILTKPDNSQEQDRSCTCHPDELEVVRASVDFVLDSRKSAAKGIDDGMATD